MFDVFSGCSSENLEGERETGRQCEALGVRREGREAETMKGWVEWL
jgi:hypothetical protein